MGSMQAAAADQEEHRGCIGRAHDRAEQQRLQRRQLEQLRRRERGEAGGERHADARQQQGRGDRATHVRRARAQAAVEQNHCQRERADQIGETGVVVTDTARPILAEQQAEHQEHQQQWRAEATRGQR